MSNLRTPYPSDVRDEEWALVAPYHTLLAETASQRRHDLREVFNGVRYMVKTGRSGGCCRMICRRGQWSTSRCAAGWQRATSKPWSMICGCSCAARRSRPSQPTAAILDSRTLQSPPESGPRAGYDGHKRHLLVATERLVLTVTVHPADIIDRDGVKRLLPHDRVDGIRTWFPRLQHVWLDAGYNGKNKGKD